MISMEFAVLGSAVISWLAVAAVLFCLFKQKRHTALTEKALDRLTRELQLANDGSIGMGRRLMAMERKLLAVQKHRVDTPASQGTSTAAVKVNQAFSAELPDAQTSSTGEEDEFEAYSEAAELLSSGVPADDVARQCGLSRAEASLIELMHHQVKGAAAA